MIYIGFFFIQFLFMSFIYWYIGGFFGLVLILRNYFFFFVFVWKMLEWFVIDQCFGDVFYVFIVIILVLVELIEGKKVMNLKRYVFIINYLFLLLYY